MSLTQCRACPQVVGQHAHSNVKYEILSANGSVFSCAEHLGKVVSNEVRAHGPVEVKDV